MPGRKDYSMGGRGGRRRRRRWLETVAENAPPAPKVDVGASLRALREERDLTIRALAEMSGLNVNTLSLIENGKSSPSVNTLQQLAKALEVPVVAFFEYGQPEQGNMIHLKANNRPQAAFANGVVEDLMAGSRGCPFEAMIVEIDPLGDSGETPVVHTGHELVFCLQGQILYQVAEQSFMLEPGDSLFFEAYLPHRWRNTCPQAARAILVLCPADESDRPIERHFVERYEDISVTP